MTRNDARERNLAVVRRLWDEAFNAGNLGVLPDLVLDEFANFGKVVGPQFLRRLIAEQRSAFPDMRFAVIQELADSDWVINKVRWTGTFRGGFSFIGFDGAEPTGRSFDVLHVHGYRLANHKIAEHWAVRDDLTMHAQLLSPTVA